MTKISRALQSSNLRHLPRPCDVDVVQAAGAAAARGRLSSLGVALVEAYEAAAGDGSHSVARVHELGRHLAKHLSRWARNAGLGRKITPGPMAEQMVRELLMHACLNCHGTGTLPVVVHEASDRLREEDCPVCLGSRRAKISKRARRRAAGHPNGYTEEVAALYDYAHAEVARAQLYARNAMAKKLRER